MEPNVPSSYNKLMGYGDTVGSLRQGRVSSRVEEIVFGTLLGDGYLQPMKNGNVRLEVGHTSAQKEYVQWKYRELKEYVGAKPHLISFHDARYGKNYLQWRFKTKASAFFRPFYDYFYGREGRKKVPAHIAEDLKSPLALAVWFMDDGGRRNDSYGLFLNTLSFMRKEHEILRECLRKNFSLDSRIHWVQDGYRLYIPSKEAKRFCEIVHPYLIPSMYYKLPYNPVTTSFARLDRARDRGKPSITRRSS